MTKIVNECTYNTYRYWARIQNNWGTEQQTRTADFRHFEHDANLCHGFMLRCEHLRTMAIMRILVEPMTFPNHSQIEKRSCKQDFQDERNQANIVPCDRLRQPSTGNNDCTENSSRSKWLFWSSRSPGWLKSLLGTAILILYTHSTSMSNKIHDITPDCLFVAECS